WESMRPGSTVAPVRSITRAPGGTDVAVASPTASILRPRTTTTWLRRAWSERPSMRVPARIAIGGSAGAGDSPLAAAGTANANKRARAEDDRMSTSLPGTEPEAGVCHNPAFHESGGLRLRRGDRGQRAPPFRGPS